MAKPDPARRTNKSLPRNRSGRNSDGFSQYCGSLPIAHAFTSTWLFFGTVYPNITVSFSALYGNSNGAAGWSLIVSFTTACRYGSFSKSDSLTGLALPIASRISSLTFRTTYQDQRLDSLAIKTRSVFFTLIKKNVQEITFSFHAAKTPFFHPFLDGFFEYLVKPLSSRLSAGKKSDKFGFPASSMILHTKSLNSCAVSNSGSTMSTENMVLDIKFKGVEALVSEHPRAADSPAVAPPVVAGDPGEGGLRVGLGGDDVRDGAGGEYLFLFLEDFLGGFRRGSDDGGDGAEAEGE
nr:hypothetical protein RchiOBHm_Chr7g0200261 [Ipomoea batatas]